MLAMTKKSGYGLIAMTHLAKRPGEFISARDIADAYDMSLSLLMNVLKILSAAGYVSSSRGARGGYRLARPADQISAAEIMDAVDGPIKLAECIMHEKQKSHCEMEKSCPISLTVKHVHEALLNVLTHLTLADIAARENVEKQPEEPSCG